jgi:hypothetical protein
MEEALLYRGSLEGLKGAARKTWSTLRRLYWQFCASSEQNVEENVDSRGHLDEVSDEHEQNSLLGTIKRLSVFVLQHKKMIAFCPCPGTC